MNWKKLSPYMLALLLSISSVFARGFSTRTLNNVMDMFGDIYRDAPYLVDGIILVIIFVPLTRKLLHERLGSASSTGLGVLLVLSVIVAEIKYDFSIIQDFSIVAVVIFLSLFGISLFIMLKQFNAGTWLSISLGWLVVVGIAYFAVPDMVEMLEDNYEINYWILGMATILAGVVFIFSFIAALFGWGGGGGGGPAPPPVEPPQQG